TSLELGIDIGYIDLVIQIGSPKSVSRALQRTGRSGHDIYKISESVMIGSDRDDLVELGVMLQEAYKGHIDKVQIPQNCLDVLAQHVIGMAVQRDWRFSDALKLVRQSYCYRNLEEFDFKNVLLYLSGSFASLEKYHVYGKIRYDEKLQEFGKRGNMLRVLYSTNIGTIPDSVSVSVNLLPITRHIGNFEVVFLVRLRMGDRFGLGGKTYQYEYAKGMQAYVSLADGLKPTIPQWFSEMLPISFDLALAVSKFRGTLGEVMKNKSKKEALLFISENCHCNPEAAEVIYKYFMEQISFLNLLRVNSFHSDKNLLIEEYFSEGKRHFIFHSLFGRRVNEVLAKVLAAKISHKINRNVVIAFNDNGFVLTLSRAVNVEIKKEVFVFAQLDLDDEAREAIKQTETLKRKFRDVAVRSLMILRNYMGRKRSVGKQQMGAHVMLGISTRLANFPVIKETYREILEDHMDLKNAASIQKMLKDGEINVTVLPAYDLPSPFAQLLITQGISDVVLLTDRKAILERLHTLVLQRIGKLK
ncbi:MAG: ATP-dependent helicase, partial [Candidatus Micrarchaeota archaeon]